MPSWTIGLVRERIAEVFRVALSMESVRTLMHSLGFRKLSPRPIHPKADPQRQEDFRKNFKTLVALALPEGVDLVSVHLPLVIPGRVENRAEGHVGTGLGAARHPPTGPAGPRIRILLPVLRHLSGGRRGGRPHLRPANTDEMNRHLLDIAAKVPDGRYALVVLDGAGWHRSKALEIPANVTLLRLPPYSPDMNPVETVFQFLKSRHFANQVFETADAVVGAIWRLFGQSVKN
ncbi:MAG: winged helix-turn-helix domain-containing protein [Albidovulum sp.]|nr:winged helix-turn-helix domain-containing protein [Albidovulum sp.]